MKTFKEYLNEMAMNYGDNESSLGLSKEERKSEYSEHKNDTHHSYPTENKKIELHKKIKKESNGDTTTEYRTNDHSKKETIHRSIIFQNEPTTELPFKHEEQVEVDRKPDSGLPRGYARDVIYNHFKESNIPLKSSISQYIPGHKLWKDIAHRALNDGHHVYYHDGEKLHKSTPKNIDKHLESYFGDSSEHVNKHMILSKSEL